MFEQIAITKTQANDLLDLLNEQGELPETLEDIKCQLLDIVR